MRCPHLGTVDDPATACLFVTDAHRCFRFTPARVPPPAFQERYCLSGEDAACPVACATTPNQRQFRLASRPLRRPVVRWGLGLAGPLLLLAAGSAGLARWNDLRQDATGPSLSTGPVLGAILSERATATMIPATMTTATVATGTIAADMGELERSPRPDTNRRADTSATPAASPALSPPPSLPARSAALLPPTPLPPTPSPPSLPSPTTPDRVRVRYRMQPGDSVTAVANFFGAHVEDMLRLNGLDLTSVLYVGQELLIP